MSLYSLRYTQIHELFARKVRKLKIKNWKFKLPNLLKMDQKAILYSEIQMKNEEQQKKPITMLCVSLIWRS